MASVRRNPAYQDPYMAKAAENIAGLFAAPSGADAAGFATGNAKRLEAERLSALFNYSKSPEYNQATADRMATAAGVYNPAASYYAVDKKNSTDRYGYDVNARTTLEQERIKGSNSLAEIYSKPTVLKDGEIAHVPEQTQAKTGFAPMLGGNITVKQGERAYTPFGSRLDGAPTPLTTDQVLAAATGQLPLDVQQKRALAGPGVQTVMGANGPTMESNAGAIGLPAVPDPAKAGKTELRNFKAPDGRVGTARFDPTLNDFVETSTGTRIPLGSQTFTSQLTGSADQTGLGASVRGGIDKQLLAGDLAKDTGAQLRGLIQANPAAQGVVGALRGTVQNAIQVGGELGGFLGGNADKIQAQIAGGLHDAGLASAFDKGIPQINMLANVLAFQWAQMQGSERLSNQQLDFAKQALGLHGLDANQANSIARIDSAIDRINRDQEILRKTRGGNPTGSPGAAAAPAPGGAAKRYDANGDLIQ